MAGFLSWQETFWLSYLESEATWWTPWLQVIHIPLKYIIFILYTQAWPHPGAPKLSQEAALNEAGCIFVEDSLPH